MNRCVRLLSLIAALVFAGFVFAQSDDAAIDAAIQTLKETTDPEISVESGFRFNLTRAKLTLVRNPEKSLDKLAALLDENIVQIRLNAAIVLGEMAQNGYKDPKLTEQLQRCLRDSSIAVVFWGLTSLTNRGMPEEAQREAVAECLTKTKPELVRLTAITLAEERQIKSALPWLVEYMKELLPEYDAEVQDRLAIKQTVKEGADGSSRVGPAAGGPRIGPGPGLQAVPSVGRGADPTRPDNAAATVREVVVGYINPEEEWRQPATLAAKIREFEAEPIVRELHTLGLAVESLAKENTLDLPFTKAGSFEYNPPWKFKPCVEAAVAWLDKNRDQFNAWPEPKTAPGAEAETPAAETEGDADNAPADSENE